MYEEVSRITHNLEVGQHEFSSFIRPVAAKPVKEYPVDACVIAAQHNMPGRSGSGISSRSIGGFVFGADHRQQKDE
ncbi:hypothetical protein D3C73_1323040 [compost metagenome]